MKLFLTTLLLSAISYVGFSQTTTVVKKTTAATRTSITPKIDGIIEPEVWSNAPLIGNFYEFKPSPGKAEAVNKKTEVRILYDDVAIYVAARMNDNPDSVAHELVSRDNIGNADFVGVILDTFNDELNGFGFYVTAAGVQFDAKYSRGGNEDPSWNAVWESAVKRDEKGWVAEFKIPYSALRFSSKDIQNWGLQVTRKRTGFNQQFMWTNVDPKLNGFLNQSGILEGLTNIKAPLRLSFSPYLSAYVNNYPNNVPGVKNTTSSFNGGMDVKYGINQSFTLDVTLIPDFGQVQSDNRILNLTPFEVKYDERRQFFTEGTELFSKGDLFYSRRIGNSPRFKKDISNQLNSGETIIKSPSESKLLNATKLSGRTGKGLGIGLFNAITDRMYSEVEDVQGNTRKIESQPLTNYNVFVLDQSLKNSSSVSFVNTNVLRQGHDYDANVTAFLFNLNNKAQKYGINGAVKTSNLSGANINNNQGYSYNLSGGKTSGNFTWSYGQELSDTNYDPSDMGFYTNNNFFNQSLEFDLNDYKPGSWYNRKNAWVAMEYSRRFKESAYQSFGIYAGSYVQLKNFWSLELNGAYEAEGNNFYESRNGQVYKTPEFYRLSLYVNPNRSKPYNLGGNIQAYHYAGHSNAYNFYLFQNLRLNDKLSLGLDLNYHPSFNFVNWVRNVGAQSIFSRYNRQTVENSFDVKYSFNNKMGITAFVRHYWSDRRNKEFFVLNNQGTLNNYTGAALQNVDRDYNVFNIDFAYTWQFAPGSELSLTYKNASETDQRFYTKKYFKNFDNILSAPQNNQVAVKVLYYIDFLNLKKKH